MNSVMSDGYEAISVPVTMNDILGSGAIGRIVGTDLIVSHILPRNVTWAVSEPEFVGAMPIRQPVEFIPGGPQPFDITFTRFSVGEDVEIYCDDPKEFEWE